jgi:hypothetical protein
LGLDDAYIIASEAMYTNLQQEVRNNSALFCNQMISFLCGMKKQDAQEGITAFFEKRPAVWDWHKGGGAKP